MMPRRAALIAGLTAVVALLAWLLFVGLPRWYGGPARSTAAAAQPITPAAPGRKITAHLFYVADDGVRLVSTDRDVPFGEGTVQQAKEIVSAQIAPVAPPLLSAIPPGTTLRALFITAKGDAYVDLSRVVSTAHSGGTVNELLTVYTIVNALTANLPAVSGVQLLVDGKEVDTLAGHVDLRRPLARNLSWVQ
ncbi:MAG TPA: GerMN domain-containing protein [Vicinamibacterales bacterium]|nr:GerMN domain-containing protein [Vicinamibacterales bacterium]